MRTRKTMMMSVIAAIAATFAAGQALAVPQGAYLQQVDNSTNIAGANTGFELLWTTYDLFVALEPGDVVGALDFGVAGPNTGLITDGVFFDGVPFSGETVGPNIALAILFPDIEYDSAVTINGGCEPVIIVAPTKWNPAGVTGAWLANAVQLGAGGPNGPDDMWAARITVSIGATFIGGQMFVAGTGPNGDFGIFGNNLPLGVLNLSINPGVIAPHTGCIVPTPGTTSLLAIAALAVMRRRR